jgi:hypothetical protein
MTFAEFPTVFTIEIQERMFVPAHTHTHTHSHKVKKIKYESNYNESFEIDDIHDPI